MEPTFQIMEDSPNPPGPKPSPKARRVPPKSGTGSSTGGRAAKTAEAKFEPVDVPEAEAPAGEETVSVRTIVEKPERLNPPEAKSGPPSLDEWQDFFARFVIRLLVDAYLFLILGDFIDELSPAEANMIKLSKEDMHDIAAPLASMSNKSSFMRKRGRSIIAAADSYESIITLLMWMRRVNRVAKKHRKPKPPKTQTVSGVAMPAQQPTQEGSPNAYDDGYSNGEVNGAPIAGFGVFNPGAGG